MASGTAQKRKRGKKSRQTKRVGIRWWVDNYTYLNDEATRRDTSLNTIANEIVEEHRSLLERMKPASQLRQ